MAEPFVCRDCGKVFQHWTTHVMYETIKGKRTRRLVSGDTARHHESETGHRVVKTIGPRI